MKRSDKIADFLIMIQAINSCMKFENIRVDRDFMNATNRLTNFDIANMERTVEKANQQIKQIKYIDKVLGVDNIANKKVRLLCNLRLQNESSSLSDLANKLGAELDEEISKSAIARLFKKISNLSEKLKYENYK
jgi:DNA-binding protein WhiA